jgi:hypothetical protein
MLVSRALFKFKERRPDNLVVPTGSITSAMRIWRTRSVETDVEMNEKEKEAQVIAQRRISID